MLLLVPVHRDMKPSNMLIKIGSDNKMCIKVSEWGISEKLDTEKARNTEAPASYISPERINNVNCLFVF